MTKLQRTTFKTSRAAQYVEARALQAMPGQPRYHFADVVVKELLDNALDACETARVDPEVSVDISQEAEEQEATITVSDNGPGIPPETVRGAFDFNVFVSDKAAYRSPTRGAQGNALKTVFGIPYALGCLEPTVVEANGLRQEIRVFKDHSGELRVQPDETQTGSGPGGTRISVTLPLRRQFFHGRDWAKAFALLNPHALVKIRDSGTSWYRSRQGESKTLILDDSYHPTRDPEKRFKYLPSDPTSAHWYSREDFRRLIYSHISHARKGGQDILLRDFVRQFKGLSSTKKAKEVCAYFLEIKTLSDFEEVDPSEIVFLLDRMKFHSDPPSHTTLGSVGREHFEKRFTEFYGELERFGYKKVSGTLESGLPYTFEFAVAETGGAIGDFFSGVNFSPTFDDPLEDQRFGKAGGFDARGIEAVLEACFAHPTEDHLDDPEPITTAVAAHVNSPAPLFLDHGKTRLQGFDSEQVRSDIAAAMFSVLKPYLKEGKKRVKTQRATERAANKKGEPQPSLKEAAFQVMEDAWRHVSGDGRLPVSARRQFYAVRHRIRAITDKRFNPDRGYDYFAQKLLPEYQRQRIAEGKEPLAGIYYDPRGKLYEAHTGTDMDLGTRDVEDYEFPPYTFNKLLYVERRGQLPLLQAAKIPERFDMALVTEAGFSTVAARTLLSGAGEKYQIFCLHDADYPGYNILRTLREATERMPKHSMEVFDIGLTVEQVIDMGKEPEEYERRSKLPKGLIPTLNEAEREWFIGEFVGKRGNKEVRKSKRFELDDLTAPEMIEHIERRLEELGAEPKVIPPEDFLESEGKKLFRGQVGGWVDATIDEVLGTAELKKEMAKEFEERFKLQGAEAWIETGFKREDSQSWRDAFKATLQAAYDAKHKDALEKAVRESIRNTVADDERDNREERT
jgi:hypothetical protein